MNSSERQQRFCENIANGLGNEDAAIEAGYAPTSAAAQATRLLKKDKIQAKIAELRKERQVRAAIDADRVTKELAAIAFADVLDIFEDDWQIKDLADIKKKPSLSHAIKSVQVIEKKNSKGILTERKVTVRMHDKIRALDNLAVQLGLKMDDVTAIAALLKYGEVIRTDRGYRFEYNEDLVSDG